MELNKKILILSISRSGSTYLTNLISHYTGFKSIHEPFQEENLFNFKEKRIDNVINKCKNLNVVLKTHINQFNSLSVEQQNYFLSHNWYKILLMRKNLHKSILSHLIATSLDNFGDKEYSNTDLFIHKDEYLEVFYFKLSCLQQMIKLKQENKIEKVLYFEEFIFKNSNDIENLNLPFPILKRKNKLLTNKTPNEKIKILNKNELDELYFSNLEKINLDGIEIDKGYVFLK